MRAASAEVIQAYASSTSFFFITAMVLLVVVIKSKHSLSQFSGFWAPKDTASPSGSSPGSMWVISSEFCWVWGFVGYSSSKKMIGSMFLNHQQ